MRLDIVADRDFVVFTTREFAARAGISVSAATRQLDRVATAGVLTRVTRGIWANVRDPAFHPLACVPTLLGKEQGYVSFLTALHLHGLIGQIPTRMQVATTGHGRRLATPVGTFEFFRIAPRLMRHGVIWSQTRLPHRIATPEKALFDTLYISTRKGRRFRALPEIDLSAPRFRPRAFRELVRAVEDRRTASAIERRFATLTRRA